MIDTTKILPGQEFKNMQELSVALTGQKMPAGKGYVLQQEKFKLYFSWKKITGTHKLIIDEIYKEPKTKPKRKQKEYCPHGKYNSAIYANLQHLELNKKYSVTDLYELLGFTSDRFTRPKYFLDCVNATELSLSSYRYFHKKINCIIAQILYINLRKFEEKGCISYHMDYAYTFKEGHKPVDIPIDYMEDVKAQALAQTSYKDEWSILHSSKAKEYTDFILKKLEPLGVKRYTKCYVFTEIKQFNTLPLSDPHTLNNLIIQKLKDASSKCDALNNKKMNSIIDSAVRLQ